MDGFDQDEAESKRDERAVILRRLLASKCDTLEAFELADRLFGVPVPCRVFSERRRAYPWCRIDTALRDIFRVGARRRGLIWNRSLCRRVRRAIEIRTDVEKRVEAKPNARWSLDFLHDQLACGRRLRILNIADDVTRERLAAIPDTSISCKRVACELTPLIKGRGKPQMIVSDNGTDTTSITA